MVTDRPLIGINAEHLAPNKGGTPRSVVHSGYYECLLAAGALPIIIPPLTREHDLAPVLDRLDGVILVEGDDMDPVKMGLSPHPAIRTISVSPLDPQAGLDRQHHQLRAVPCPELQHRPADVRAHRRRADHERRRDLVVGPAGGHPGDHLALPFGEVGDPRVRRRAARGAGGEVLDDPAGHGGGEERPPVGDDPEASAEGPYR